VYYKTNQDPPITVSLNNPLTDQSYLVSGDFIKNASISIGSSTTEFYGQCIPSSECLNLRFSVPKDTIIDDQREYFDFPIVTIQVNGVYFGNQVLWFADHRGRDDEDDDLAFVSEEYNNYSFPLGNCTRETLCGANGDIRELSLLTVKVDTRGYPELMPPNWFEPHLYNMIELDIRSSPPVQEKATGPPLLSRIYDEGYPALSQSQHYKCIKWYPQMTFGWYNSIEGVNLSYSVELNGVAMPCQYRMWEDSNTYIMTPLDGSCPRRRKKLSTGATVAIVMGSVVVAVVGLLVVFYRWYAVRKR
jgi:hypothetical protein